VLDRVTGEFLEGKPFAKVTWTTGLDDSGHPVRVAEAKPSREGTLVYPGVQGATNWFSPSYSPHTGLFYIPAWENYSSVFNKLPAEYFEGRRYTAGTPRSPVPSLRGTQVINRTEEEGYGAIRAFDPKTGVRKWEFKMTDVTSAGVLTTASDLLFTGGREGYFWALDARTGAELWRANLGGDVASGPMTYAINGRQYVAVSAGNSLFTFALRQ
ncbi:MAG TPA: PQQ-binding-like beta-propeller repeat protein, partial [Bryobacteraceae bacterium]|nr:PQQ-binding-like beta-propeller repeat protein [Bryobacteraceae bacterium]